MEQNNAPFSPTLFYSIKFMVFDKPFYYYYLLGLTRRLVISAICLPWKRAMANF